MDIYNFDCLVPGTRKPKKQYPFSPDLKLKIEQKKDGGKLLCKLTGWLDPNTSPMLLEQVDVAEVNTL